MKLLLFDIDGTLLVSRGSGRIAMQETVRRMTGKRDVTTEGVDFSGRTDPQIIRDVFLHNGFASDEADARLPEALSVYTETFQEAFEPDMFDILPGVQTLIEALDKLPDVQLSVLTGNLEVTGYLKLRAIGLEDFFPFGAFGSDSANRYDLPRIALDRALQNTGTAYAGKNVFIIGDTRHDILCGRDLDVFTVAVSTGHYSSEDLSVHNPDVLLDDLSDTDYFVQLLTQ